MKISIFGLKRSIKHLYQKLTRGFSDEDLWNLDHTMAVLILPRLKAFKAQNGAFPGCEPMETPEKWDSALDEMIFAMQVIKDQWTDLESPREDWERCLNGLKLFGEWFRALWW